MKSKSDQFSAVLTQGLALLLVISLVACTTKSKAPQSSAALEKAKRFKMDELYYDGLPLTAAISMLRDECLRRDPARKGVAISLGPDAQQFTDSTISLRLKDVTLEEALRRIADSVGLELQANDTELLLVRKKAKP